MDKRKIPRAKIAELIQRRHDDTIAEHHRIFFEYPPDDDGCYAYTYYDGTGYPLYHGYTANARWRAKEHCRKAPWAGWAEYVRYRRCSSPAAARRLERRLQNKVGSFCQPEGMTYSYHGQDWSERDREAKVSHVGDYCKLPGGVCDVKHQIERLKDELV